MDFHKVLSMYSDVFHYCSTPAAPWYLVPANHHWFTGYSVLKLLVDILGDLQQKKWDKEVSELVEKQKKLFSSIPRSLSSSPSGSPSTPVYSLTSSPPSSRSSIEEEQKKKIKTLKTSAIADWLFLDCSKLQEIKLKTKPTPKHFIF
eukprot:TRINITY_DN2595_c0_g1_i2.p1 TRINITY_DN2595_c0_g1~~TRINITY_DN2595_c0_g1_i2.p1  ORF type:complete len:147 (-),score=49.67 TRINITY_DN2595_c0_g1_i2:85-525(-)